MQIIKEKELKVFFINEMKSAAVRIYITEVLGLELPNNNLLNIYIMIIKIFKLKILH